MPTLEMELRELAEQIKYKGKIYTLFIYKEFGGWCVGYFKGRYFCDANNGCCEDQYGSIYSHTSASLIDSVKKVQEYIIKMDK